MTGAAQHESSSTPTSASLPPVACVKKQLPPPPRPPGACYPKTRRRASFHISSGSAATTRGPSSGSGVRARVGIKLWVRVDGVKVHAIDATGSARAGHENRGRQRRRDFRDGSAPAMPPAPPSLRDLFADDTKPLRLDLGCGLGAAARGWAAEDSTRNVLGVDASRSLVKACAARAARDECGANLAYVAADARSILAAASKYAGPLEAISVQHPTPPDTSGALDWILSPDVVDAARDALAPGGVVAVETRSERAATAAREGLAKAGFALVSDAWPLPDGARSETGGACVALGWAVERLVFRVP